MFLLKLIWGLVFCCIQSECFFKTGFDFENKLTLMSKTSGSAFAEAAVSFPASIRTDLSVRWPSSSLEEKSKCFEHCFSRLSSSTSKYLLPKVVPGTQSSWFLVVVGRESFFFYTPNQPKASC